MRGCWHFLKIYGLAYTNMKEQSKGGSYASGLHISNVLLDTQCFAAVVVFSCFLKVERLSPPFVVKLSIA